MTFVSLRPQLVILVPALQDKAGELEQQIKKMKFELATAQAEITMLRKRQKANCPNCASMMEETRLLKLQRRSNQLLVVATCERGDAPVLL